MSRTFTTSSSYSVAAPGGNAGYTNVTIACWVNATSYTGSWAFGGGPMVSVCATAGDIDRVAIFGNGSGGVQVGVTISDRTQEDCVILGGTLNVWQHVALVIDGAGNITGYLNGVPNTTLGLNEGARPGWASLTWTKILVGPFAGQLSDVVVVRSALGQEEILGLMRGRGFVEGTGIGSWPLHADSPLMDASGKGLAFTTTTGTPTAGTSWPPIMRARGASVVLPPQYAAAAGGPALTGSTSSASTLAGTLSVDKPLAASTTSASTLSASLSVGAVGIPTRFTGGAEYTRTVSIAGTQVHTLCAWARSDDTAIDATVLHLDNGTDTDSSRMGFVDLSGTDSAVFVQHRTGVGSTAVLPATAYNVWHHLALVIDGTNQVSYIDGVQVDSRAFNASLRTTGFTSIRIGTLLSSTEDLSVYDAQVYTSALSAADILTVMRGSIPGGATLYGRWMLDRSDPLADTSGNGRTLSVTGTPVNATKNVLYGPGAQVASTLSGTLSTGGPPLTGSASVASTLAGSLSTTKPITGSSAASSTLAATLGVALALTGSTSSASQLAATLAQAVPLTGSTSSASTLSGTLATGTQIAGTTSSASTLAGSLAQLQPLTGSSSAASTLAATLVQGVGLAGAESVASTLAGTLGQAVPLAGSGSSASTLSGTLALTTPLSGSSSTASTLAAALSQAQPLAGAESVASTLAATLGVDKPLTGSLTTASTLSGTLGQTGVFAGTSAVTSTLAATLLIAKPLVGSDSVASTLAAALSVAKPIAGTHTAASTLAATLGTAKPLTGTSATASTLSAALQLTTALAGGTQAASTLAATLRQVQALSGAAATSSTLTATLSGGGAPVLPVVSGWDDGGDIPDETAAAGTWLPAAEDDATHEAWTQAAEVEMAPHGKWYEEPVAGGIDTTWIAGRARSASSLAGTVTRTAIEPSLVATLGGAGSYQLQKNWIFGTTGNIGTASALNTEFTYHDPFNTITNGTNYGAMIVRAPGAPTFGVYNYADIGMANDQQPVDPGTRYREFTSDSMLAHVKPLNTGSTVVGPASAHNAGCGSLVSKLTYPAGGTRLGQTIVWETRCRIVNAPNGYWFALWIVGPQWDGGPEIDAIEAFSSTSPNVNGDLWNSNGIGGSNSKNYFGGPWDNTISTLGFPGYALPNGAQSLRNWHVFTMEYKADNSFRMYMDSTLIQSGSLDWKVPTGSTVPTLQFLFDFGFGHTAISPINTAVISDINATPLTYEIAYSRIWLR